MCQYRYICNGPISTDNTGKPIYWSGPSVNVGLRCSPSKKADFVGTLHVDLKAQTVWTKYSGMVKTAGNSSMSLAQVINFYNQSS